MIVFTIPLRAKETTNNWNECVRRINNTIASIFNQVGSSNFRCIVVCNDAPPLEEDYDDRLEFIELKMPIPTNWLEMAHDKFWKMTVAAVRIRKILEQQEKPENGIYVMPVDADDLLNCHIAEWCESHPDENGFISADGYVWTEGKHYLRIYNEMYTYCGSCNIIKMYKEDLPEKIPVSETLCHDTETAKKLNARYPIRFDHNIVVERYTQMGRPFAILPFRSTIYVQGTGDNISAIWHAEHDEPDTKLFHPVAFLRSINIFKMKRISGKIKKEFGMKKE